MASGSPSGSLDLASPRAGLSATAFDELLESLQVAGNTPRDDTHRIAHLLGDPFRIILKCNMIRVRWSARW
jgi:hypothetical protein